MNERYPTLPDAELVAVGSDWASSVAWKTYPDGLPIFSAPERIPSAILLRPRDLGSVFTALCWVDALAERGHLVPHLVLPCIPGARQDRLNDSGDYLFTVKSVAAAINARRFPSVTVLDPHSDVGPALIDRCRVAHPTFPKTTEYIGVIAPDGGAEKRAYRVAASLGVPLYHAWKSRSVATGQLTGFGIEPIQPGRYLIVDDICDGGGTFIGLADVLDPNVEADLYVTHGLFTRGAQPLLDCFNRVYCTDSTLGEKPGVTILPRCASLLDSLLGTIL
jgi:ribose-phosphate pyrophosphokinase